MKLPPPPDGSIARYPRRADLGDKWRHLRVGGEGPADHREQNRQHDSHGADGYGEVRPPARCGSKQDKCRKCDEANHDREVRDLEPGDVTDQYEGRGGYQHGNEADECQARQKGNPDATNAAVWEPGRERRASPALAASTDVMLSVSLAS